MRYTPENITKLNPGEIFVFGSNLLGHHLNGAARTAVRKFGAKMGQGVGPQGRSYAIPTMQGARAELIGSYVNDFIAYAVKHPELTFLVTRIGCGTAGYNDWQIAPLFREALDLPNVLLPEPFVRELQREPQEGVLLLSTPQQTDLPLHPSASENLAEYIYRLSDYCPTDNSADTLARASRFYAADPAIIEGKVRAELEQLQLSWTDESVDLRVKEIRYAATLGNVISAFLFILRRIPGKDIPEEMLNDMLKESSLTDAAGFTMIRDEALQRLENISDELIDFSWDSIITALTSIVAEVQYRVQGVSADWLNRVAQYSTELAEHVGAVNSQRARTEFAAVLLAECAMMVRKAESGLTGAKAGLKPQLHKLWLIVKRDAPEIAELLPPAAIALGPGQEETKALPWKEAEAPLTPPQEAPLQPDYGWIEQCYKEQLILPRHSGGEAYVSSADYLSKSRRCHTAARCLKLVDYLTREGYLEADPEQQMLFVARITGRRLRKTAGEWPTATKVRWHGRNNVLELMSLYRALCEENISAKDLQPFFECDEAGIATPVPGSIPSAAYRLDQSPTAYCGKKPEPAFQKDICRIFGLKYHGKQL